MCQYLREVEEQNPVEEPVPRHDKVSTTDPDSTCATKGGTPARLGYLDNYLVDNDICGRESLACSLFEDEPQMGAGSVAIRLHP